MTALVRFAPGAAPPRAVVLYDGHCRFCKAQMKNLLGLAKPGSIEPVSFQDEGVLERFEGLTWDECMEAMHLVTPEGRVYRGMEAAVRAVVTRPFLGAFAWLYYVPGIRHALDALFRAIAKRRDAIAGRESAAGGCDENGASAVHFADPK